MSYGLMNAGANKKATAMSGLRKTAQDETQRNIANDNIEQAESAQKKSNAGMGASTGAVIGAQMASGMGLGAASVGLSALASGGLGLVGGLLLSELF